MSATHHTLILIHYCSIFHWAHLISALYVEKNKFFKKFKALDGSHIVFAESL